MGYPTYSEQNDNAEPNQDEPAIVLTPAQAQRALAFQQAAKILKDANPAQPFTARRPIPADDIIQLGYAIVGPDVAIDRPADDTDNPPTNALLELLNLMTGEEEMNGSTEVLASTLVVGQQMTRGGDLVTDIQATPDGDLSVTVRCEHGPGDPHDTTIILAPEKMISVWPSAEQ